MQISQLLKHSKITAASTLGLEVQSVDVAHVNELFKAKPSLKCHPMRGEAYKWSVDCSGVIYIITVEPKTKREIVLSRLKKACKVRINLSIFQFTTLLIVLFGLITRDISPLFAVIMLANSVNVLFFVDWREVMRTLSPSNLKMSIEK